MHKFIDFLESKIYRNLKVAKFQILFPWGSSIKYVRKIFRKTNISNPLKRTPTYAYQGVRNVSFSENFAYALNGWLFVRVLLLFSIS